MNCLLPNYYICWVLPFFCFSSFKIDVPNYFLVKENLTSLCPNTYFTRFPFFTHLFSTAIWGLWQAIYYWNFLIIILTNKFFTTLWIHVINRRLWKIKIMLTDKKALFNRKKTLRTNNLEQRHSVHIEEDT